MLNFLYKIISGRLSHRVKDTLDHVFSETQPAFRKGRYVVENTRFIYDLLSFTTGLLYIPGFLVFNNFEKKGFILYHGFFINKYLEFVAFGGYIIEWIYILNTKYRA